MTFNSNFFIAVGNITDLLNWPLIFGLQKELRSRQPATLRIGRMYFNPLRTLISRIHMSPLLRSESIMNLINSVGNKGLESSLLVGNVLKDCQGVRPECDTLNRQVQLIRGLSKLPLHLRNPKASASMGRNLVLMEHSF